MHTVDYPHRGGNFAPELRQCFHLKWPEVMSKSSHCFRCCELFPPYGAWKPPGHCNPLSFFSLMFLVPWCFSRIRLVVFWVFSAYFPRFLGVRQVRKILGVFEVCLGFFEMTKEKKDRDPLQPPKMGKITEKSQNCILGVLFPLFFSRGSIFPVLARGS